MIIDAFIFGGFGAELDILEIRLNELYDAVDYFVIVEASQTHRGQPKELNFAKNRSRFERFKNKIHYHRAEKSLTEVEGDLWINENRHRNQIFDALVTLRINYSLMTNKNLPDDSWVIISDCDEIPSAKSIKELERQKSEYCGIPLSYHAFFLNVVAGNPIVGCRAVRLRSLLETNPQHIRNDSYHSFPRTISAGWHLTYQGGKDSVKQKLESFAHGNDFDPRFGKHTKDISFEEISADLDILATKLYHPIANGWRKVGWEKLPAFIQENKEKFKTWMI